MILPDGMEWDGFVALSQASFYEIYGDYQMTDFQFRFVGDTNQGSVLILFQEMEGEFLVSKKKGE